MAHAALRRLRAVSHARKGRYSSAVVRALRSVVIGYGRSDNVSQAAASARCSAHADLRGVRSGSGPAARGGARRCRTAQVERRSCPPPCVIIRAFFGGSGYCPSRRQRPMVWFALVAIVLAGMAVLLLVVPLLRTEYAAAESPRDANVSIYRDQVG